MNDHLKTLDSTPRDLVVVTAGIGQPSTTQVLGKQLGEATVEALNDYDVETRVHAIDLRELASDLGAAMVSTAHSPELDTALKKVYAADGIVAVSPTFKVSYSGMFKSFFDLVDDDLLSGIPVAMGATGGTARHSLMLDYAMRPLFSYLRMRPTVSSVFAATDDFGTAGGTADAGSTDAPLESRIKRTAGQLADMMVATPAKPAFVEGEPLALEVVDFEQLLG